MSQPPANGVRLDKWLWAARFFKTRSLAKSAIETGKVLYNGERCKVSREVTPGAKLLVRQGWDDREVIVLAVSDQRGPAVVAQQLYQETDESIERRQQRAAESRTERLARVISPERPTKRQRRQIHDFQQQFLD
ncbi:MAG: S4 domain-containing protein [Spongiibacteraceae bacterium]|jgi:ribosome-associated heat shock protein Hsp15|nr:S4 domain-containing protein [Spongiibacteraceae bacterium]